jgi:hypothetical protein
LKNFLQINDDFMSFNQSSYQMVDDTQDLIRQAILFGLDLPSLLMHLF